MTECIFDGCGRQARTRNLCNNLYNQWLYRGRDLTRLTPLGLKQVKLPDDQAAADIEDFEWLLETGEHIERATKRIGLSPKALYRRYKQLGRELPAGLTALS